MPRVTQSELSNLLEEILLSAGSSSEAAETVAQALVEADLYGHHSHGVRMVATYLERIANGTIDPSASPDVADETATTLTIDGNDTLGQYVGQTAIEHGVPLAKERGVSVVAIRNATHLGCIGTWARRTAAEGVAFLGFVCNPTSTHVAPPGTEASRLSTNPLAMGLPSFDALPYPLVLDMATSQVAFGKIKEAAAAEESIPDEWAAIVDGDATPEQVVDGPGALLPLGGTVSGYKGFGLAAMIELLAANAADAEVSGEDDTTYGNIAMFVFVDVLALTSQERLEERITAFHEYVTSGEPTDGLSLGHAAMGDELGLPGEPEYRVRTDQSANGIDIRDADARTLREIAAKRNLEKLAQPLQSE